MEKRMIEKSLIRKRGRRLYTLSLEDGRERVWDPSHSKLAALMLKRGAMPFPGVKRVLYLGGGHGTTVSHISDIIPEGRIFVVEFGLSISEIIRLSYRRRNIIPIMEDAARPENYALALRERPVDMIYQDVAQRNQLEIFEKNLPFLRNGGKFIFMLKVRSVEQARERVEIAEETLEGLHNISGLVVNGMTDLLPYQREHYAFYGIKEV